MLETRLVSSLEKVGICGEPTELNQDYTFSVLLGETISFQIAYRESDKEKVSEYHLNKEVVRIHETDGVYEKLQEMEAPGIRVRRVLPVMCRYSCNPESWDEDYLFRDSRMAPDLLRDIGEESLTAGEEWQSLWVDITPGQGQLPGNYRVSVSLKPADGEKETECCADVRVIDSVLPPLSIPHTEWFHFDGIVNYYKVGAFTEEFWKIFENFLEVYVRRGGNMMYVPVLTPPLDTGVGLERTTIQLVDVEVSGDKYCFDFSNLERFLDICLADGITYFEICHLFTQWGAAAAPKVEAKVNGERKKIFGWDTPSDAPEYLHFLGELLPALKGVLAGRGLLPQTFFHISDEPDLSSAHYQTAQKAVRSLLEGCTIMEAVSDYEYYEKGLVDIPVCAVNHIEPFLEKHTPGLWSYFCCAQTVEVPNRFISMPSRRNRIYGILMYWHEISGFLHWGFNFYNSALSKEQIDPYETVDAGGTFPAGDAFLVYPGENGVPEESIRLMVQEEAISDYRALCALESRIGRDKVLELIRQEAGMELSFRQYPKTDGFILSLRDKINRLLMEKGN